ncbi:hypothetical protein DITRI_Ditri12bG0163900 [Diplodiscus trichospermus]
MSQRPSRHQRKPSQSVFVSFEDLSAPVSDNAAGNKPAPANLQPPPSQPIRAPAPPSATSAPAATSDYVAKDGERPKNATD